MSREMKKKMKNCQPKNDNLIKHQILWLIYMETSCRQYFLIHNFIKHDRSHERQNIVYTFVLSQL